MYENPSVLVKAIVLSELYNFALIFLDSVHTARIGHVITSTLEFAHRFSNGTTVLPFRACSFDELLISFGDIAISVVWIIAIALLYILCFLSCSSLSLIVNEGLDTINQCCACSENLCLR